MSKKPKIFKIHFTIVKKAEQYVKYKAVPVPILIIAESYNRAIEVGKEEVQEFLDKNNCYIKSIRHTEIKVLKCINDFKRNES